MAIWNIWHLIFTYDFGVKVTNLMLFYLALYGYYVVQFSAKLVKSFKIYRKMKYMTFDFDLR